MDLKIHIIQLNLSTMTTLVGQNKVTIDWNKSERIDCPPPPPPPKKKMAVVERWPLVEIRL